MYEFPTPEAVPSAVVDLEVAAAYFHNIQFGTCMHVACCLVAVGSDHKRSCVAVRTQDIHSNRHTGASFSLSASPNRLAVTCSPLVLALKVYLLRLVPYRSNTRVPARRMDSDPKRLHICCTFCHGRWKLMACLQSKLRLAAN